MKNSILVVVAHPDDEVLGCGGIIKRLTSEGNKVCVLIIGSGITSRAKNKEISANQRGIDGLKNETKRANKILGVKQVFFADFPDNRFDEIPLLDLIKKIEEIKKLVNPTIVYTHHRGDLNVDHRITYHAVMTAFRPLPAETIKEVYSFEVLSSTEWNYPNTFNPNVYLNIASTIKDKVMAMKKYKNELRDWPHPRSIKSINILAQKRGSEVGMDYAEAFELVRKIKS